MPLGDARCLRSLRHRMLSDWNMKKKDTFSNQVHEIFKKCWINLIVFELLSNWNDRIHWCDGNGAFLDHVRFGWWYYKWWIHWFNLNGSNVVVKIPKTGHRSIGEKDGSVDWTGRFFFFLSSLLFWWVRRCWINLTIFELFDQWRGSNCLCS